MWECSNCKESVEDTFDLCWNCGTSRDGTVDPKFERVADDPSTVGLVFFLEAIREAVGIVWIAHEYSIAAEVLYHSRTWTAIVELALSLWLILGSRASSP